VWGRGGGSLWVACSITSVLCPVQVRFGSLLARSQDGLILNLETSYNYRLRLTIEDISQLYLDFGEMEEVSREEATGRVGRYSSYSLVACALSQVSVFYSRVSQNVIRDTASQYTGACLRVFLCPLLFASVMLGSSGALCVRVSAPSSRVCATHSLASATVPLAPPPCC
jgi:hypothetical protein